MAEHDRSRDRMKNVRISAFPRSRFLIVIVIDRGGLLAPSDHPESDYDYDYDYD